MTALNHHSDDSIKNNKLRMLRTNATTGQKKKSGWHTESPERPRPSSKSSVPGPNEVLMWLILNFLHEAPC